MADNLPVTPGGGATVAADEVGGALYQRVKIAVGPDGTADDVDGTHPLSVAGIAVKATGTFTRPNDTNAYASGDLVANNTTAGSVTPVSLTVARVAAGSGAMFRCRLKKSGAVLTNASFRVHFYSVSPTCANGDNDAWSTNNAANYIGAMDVTMDKAFTDGAHGAGVPAVGNMILFALASGTVVYALVEARAAYTPAAQEVFTIAVECIQN